MKKEVKRNKDNSKSSGGLAIPAGILIGMGLGFLLNNLVAWMFIGLGLGFVVFMILRMIGK
jgi:hypothetical protein